MDKSLDEVGSGFMSVPLPYLNAFDHRLFLQSPEAFVVAVAVVMAPVPKFWALQVSALLLVLVSLTLHPQKLSSQHLLALSPPIKSSSLTYLRM
jgi:hypothetical protein